jgi:hypothetical protein
MKKLTLTHWILIGGIIFFSGCIVVYTRKNKNAVAKIKEKNDEIAKAGEEKRLMTQDAADAIAFEIDAEKLKETSQRQIAGTYTNSEKKIILLNEKGYEFVPKVMIGVKTPATALYKGGIVRQVKGYKYSDGIVG